MDKSDRIKQLEKEIESICETLTSLTAKEKKTESPQSGIEQVEQGNLLRRIRAQRREADKSLVEKTSARAKLQYEVNTSSGANETTATEEENIEPNKVEDQLELEAANKSQYIRIRNVMGILSEEIECKKNLIITAIT